MNWNSTDREDSTDETFDMQDGQATLSVSQPEPMLNEMRVTPFTLSELQQAAYDFLIRLLRR